MIACEIFVAMNENGEWIMTNDSAEAVERLKEDMGGELARVVKVTINMSPPEMPESSIDIPDNSGDTVQITS